MVVLLIKIRLDKRILVALVLIVHCLIDATDLSCPNGNAMENYEDAAKLHTVR